MSIAPPLNYSPDVEQIAPDEDETVAELNRSFDKILTTTSEDYGHAVRSVHAKAHAVLKGTLSIDDGLPPELAQGLFATPGEHAAYVRMSTNAGDVLDDAISLPRGLALKILDVAGERLPDAEGTTQDFIFVNGPVFQAKTPEAFAKNLKLLAATTDKAEGGKKVMSAVLRGLNTALTSVGIESAAIKTLGGAPNVEPLGETFFTATPFRYGDHIAKLSLAPATPQMQALTGETIDASEDRDAIRHQVREEMRGMDVVFELRVQLCRDIEKQPVEDPTVEWLEEDTPFQRVGELRIPAQDSWADEQVDAIDERMRFSIWTGLAAHRPLGAINRARKDTYSNSAGFRARFNGCPIHEPVGAVEAA
ncbi:catalase family protein [Sphingomonas sp. RS2018]